MTLAQLKRLLLTWRDPNNQERSPDVVCDLALQHIERMENALRLASVAMISWRKDDALTAIQATAEALRHVEDYAPRGHARLLSETQEGSQTGSAEASRPAERGAA